MRSSARQRLALCSDSRCLSSPLQVLARIHYRRAAVHHFAERHRLAPAANQRISICKGFESRIDVKIEAFVKRKTQDLVRTAAEDLLLEKYPELRRVDRAELWTFEIEGPSAEEDVKR